MIVQHTFHLAYLKCSHFEYRVMLKSRPYVLTHVK
jgi:DNA-directed RNA polymerase subunit RPC12/RpoP